MAVDFGKDVSCTTSLRAGRFSTGARLVGEAVYRRLTTPRGMLRGGDDEANYGFDLTELIGTVGTSHAAASLGARIKNELLKDERIINCSVEVVRTTDGPAAAFEISIDAETTEGPFDLKIAVTEVSVELLKLNAE